MPASNQYYQNTGPIKLILLTGLLVGSLDILSAFADYYIATGKGPETILRYIASGVFGSKAFSGNNSMMFWGLFFHFVIAFAFTLFFYWLYPKVKPILPNPVLVALFYAIFMWIVTTRIILPLSNTAPSTFHFWKAVKAILILLFMIALPLSYIMKNYFSKAADKKNQERHNLFGNPGG